jgi:uncharacterized protein YkwD/uncharacterized membrane protein required for colicin V production
VNYFDLVIIVFIILMGLWGYFRGAVREAGQIVVTLLALFISVNLYQYIYQMLPTFSIIPSSFMRSVSFFVVFFFFEIVLYIVNITIQAKLPESMSESIWEGYLGAIFGAIKGILIILILIPLIWLLPLTSHFAKEYQGSLIVRATASPTKAISTWTTAAFSDVGAESNNFVTLANQKDPYNLGFSNSRPANDSLAADHLLELVNAEREKAGSDNLGWDDNLAKVAVAQAKELASEGKLSHLSSNKKSFTARIAATGNDLNYANEPIAVGGNADEVVFGMVSDDSDKSSLDSPVYNKFGAAVVGLGSHGVLVVMELTD